MNNDMDIDTKIYRQLSDSKVIAVVGISPKEERPSHYVAKYLKKVGYRVIPVNPTQSSILGETCYPDLRSIPHKVEMVDVFRRPEHAPEIVKEAAEIGARFVWLQDDVISVEAASIAEREGISIVMDN